MRCRQCNQRLLSHYALNRLVDGRPLDPVTLCESCQALFDRIATRPCCPDCGRAVGPERCRDCVRWFTMGVESLHNRAFFTYNDAMKAWMEQYKGMGDYRMRDAFLPEVNQLRRLRGFAFVPLTTEPGHFDKRGFDPVVGLFDALPLQLWLRKQNTEMPQAKKNRAARLKTPQSFQVVAAPNEMNRFKQICLLDDLYTTGRTLHHAAAAIRAAGYSGRVISRSLIR